MMMIMPNRIPGGLRIDQPITLRDIPQTVLDLCQLTGKDRFPGQPLSRCWQAQGEAPPEPLLSFVARSPRNPPTFPVSRGDMHSVCIGDFQYIRNGDGVEEVYDLRNDPKELHDIAKTDEGQRVISECHRHMNDHQVQLK
jgi:arylsulfatase A-like enzyme